VIPTAHKTKIPKALSYPLNAKAISEALNGVPQFEVLTIDFRFWKGFAKNRVPNAPHHVLDAIYGRSDIFTSSPWQIIVYPLPRPLKHEVQIKLIAEALPKIRKWLESNQHSLDRDGGHRLTFFFDDLADELTTEEYSSAEWKTERV